MTAIYNELDPYAAEWMVNLERAGYIAPGIIDERSIREVQPEDVAGATQFHAFAGIAVWSHALRLAGWPDDVSVWTGSCPCQPFSAAGKRKGFADDRHLWPEWFRLIRECRPVTIFGEQVASADGRRWFDAVSDDLEGLGYTVGAASLPACGVGAPHLRQRLFFVAYSPHFRRGQVCADTGGGKEGGRSQGVEQRPMHGGHGDVADPDSERRDGLDPLHQQREGVPEASRVGESSGLVDPEASIRRGARAAEHTGRGTEEVGRSGVARELGHSGSKGSGRHPGAIPGQESEGESEGGRTGNIPNEPVDSGATRGFWADAEWIPCRDGRARPVKRGSFPLAHGSSGRMAVVRANGHAEEETHWYNRTGALKGIGNCIVPQVAATFVRAFMDLQSLDRPAS